MEKIRENAAAWMIQRGWKRLIAKHRNFEQSLFEHTMVELDGLLSVLKHLLKGGFTQALTPDPKSAIKRPTERKRQNLIKFKLFLLNFSPISSTLLTNPL